MSGRLRRWLGLDARDRFVRDLHDELDSHIERRADDLVRSGIDRDAAIRRARMEFGAMPRYREEILDAAWWTRAALWPGQLGTEAMHALRRLRATPMFTVFAVTSLAVGLGVTTSIYAVVVSMLWRPLEVPRSHELVVLTTSRASEPWRSALSREDFAPLQGTAGGWQDASILMPFSWPISTPEFADMASGEAVGGGYFGVLGLKPAHGRLLQPADDRMDAPFALVISHRFWRMKFREQPSAVGSVVKVFGQPFEIVGVTPPGFQGLGTEIQTVRDVWMTVSTAIRASTGSTAVEAAFGRVNFSAVVRIPGEQSVDALAASARALSQRLDVVRPITERGQDGAMVAIPRGWSARRFDDLSFRPTGSARVILVAVFALLGLVLAVASTNLANLMIARGTARRAEIAVRRALGASRARLVREQLIESLILGVAGGLGAWGIVRIIAIAATVDVPFAPGRVVSLEPRLTVPVVLAAAGGLLVSLVVFGLMPALRLAGGDLRPEIATNAGGDRKQVRSRDRLISLQTAVSTAFLMLAIFFGRAVVAESKHDSGIAYERMVIGVMNFRVPGWPEDRAKAAVNRILAAGHGRAGFDVVAVSSGLPYGIQFTPFAAITRAEHPFSTARTAEDVGAPFLASSPGAFAAMGVLLVRGRLFDERDAPGTTPVIILSEFIAKELFGSDTPLGRQVAIKNVLNMADRTSVWTRTVVGTVGDTDSQAMNSRTTGTIYVPLAQHWEPTLVLMARTSGDPAALTGALRMIAREGDPDLTLDGSMAGRMALAGKYVFLGALSTIAIGLAGLTLLLAMAGLFGVISHAITRRSREMGVRIALGAGAWRIKRMVLGDGLRPVLAGVFVGMGLGLSARVLLSAAFSGFPGPEELLVFLAIPAPFVVAAMLACYLPAARAARVDPNVALRDW